MKFTRTPSERKLLSMLKELETDNKIVKRKHDSKSHRNVHLIKQKIHLVQNALNSFRRTRMPQKTFVDIPVPNTPENRSFQRKIIFAIENSNIDNEPKYFIKMSKKDVKKGRLTPLVLKSILTYIGDKTWTSIDFDDTVEQVLSGTSKGIAYIPYKSYRKGKLPDDSLFLSMNGVKGEYSDISKKNISWATKKMDKVFTLKEFISFISDKK